MKVASNSSQHVDLVLQESCTDHSGSLLVYSTVDVDSVQLAMNSEDSSCIPLLPVGFSIVPAACPSPVPGSSDAILSPPEIQNGPTLGCLLTVGLQVLASTIPATKISLSSITDVNTHICNTVQQIGAALCSSSLNCSMSNVGPVAGFSTEPSGSPSQ